MEESRSGMIKIHDVSYDVLRYFVHFLYTAEVLLDEQLACDLLVLAEKYQVKHLKAFCEEFMTSKMNNDHAIAHYTFGHRHDAYKRLLEAAPSLIMHNMAELVQKDSWLVVEIYEAYLTRQVNTAAIKVKSARVCTRTLFFMDAKEFSHFYANYFMCIHVLFTPCSV